MISNFFYVSRRRHLPGEQLDGGDFGLGFQRYVYENRTDEGAASGWRLASELIIDRVRAERFAHLPSRFQCSFAFDDEAMARRYLTLGSLVYEVRLVDHEALVHRAARNLMEETVRFQKPYPFVEHTEQIAEAYWAGRNIEAPEILTLSKLEVVDCLD